MTLLAPEIVEAIVEGRQGPEVTLAARMEPFEVEWEGQLDFVTREPNPSARGVP